MTKTKPTRTTVNQMVEDLLPPYGIVTMADLSLKGMPTKDPRYAGVIEAFGGEHDGERWFIYQAATEEEARKTARAAARLEPIACFIHERKMRVLVGVEAGKPATMLMRFFDIEEVKAAAEKHGMKPRTHHFKVDILGRSVICVMMTAFDADTIGLPV